MTAVTVSEQAPCEDGAHTRPAEDEDETVAIIWPSNPNEPVLVKSVDTVSSISVNNLVHDQPLSNHEDETADDSQVAKQQQQHHQDKGKRVNSRLAARARRRKPHNDGLDDDDDNIAVGIFDSLSLHSSKCSSFRHHRDDDGGNK
ncbi:hypothetical protein ACA910_008170 [Epithemia clementina (nom. ined.)]